MLWIRQWFHKKPRQSRQESPLPGIHGNDLFQNAGQRLGHAACCLLQGFSFGNPGFKLFEELNAVELAIPVVGHWQYRHFAEHGESCGTPGKPCPPTQESDLDSFAKPRGQVGETKQRVMGPSQQGGQRCRRGFFNQ